MFQVDFRPSQPAQSERCTQIMLLWFPGSVIIILVFIFTSWIWGSAVTLVVVLFMSAFTSYYFQSAPPETEPIRISPSSGADIGIGLSQSDISTIPEFAYERNVGWIQCAICIATVKEGEIVRQLPVCKHMFHVKCIDEWLGSNPTCPMCRANVKIGEMSSDPTCPPV